MKVFSGALLAFGLAQFAQAGDGSVAETVVWELQGHDIAASYSRDRDGVGKLRFRDVQSRKALPVTFLLDNDRDIAEHLTLVGMQDFNGLFVVTLETATGYVVQIFVFDERQQAVVEVATDGGRWLPEMIHYGDLADPAIGILRQPMSSRQKDASLICGQRFYVLNQRTRGVEKVEGRWPYRRAGSDAQCSD